jgi:LysR family transcriptional regulator, transcriptional activator for dmlA
VNSRLTLQDMDLFCQIIRAGSFAAAARALGVSPALVSKRVSILEAAMETRLFHRTTRAVSLTDDGETLHQWSVKILDDVGQMQDVIMKAHDQPRGVLRIASSTGFGRNRLAPALSELMRVHPELGVQLELLDRPVDIVGEGFDVDIRVGGVHEPNLLSKPLARNWRVLCAAPSYLAAAGAPDTLADLARHRCIVIRERDQSGVWRLSGPNGVESVRPPPGLSSNNGEVVHQWGVDGHGVFLRSIWDVAADLRAGRLTHVLPAYRQDADVTALYAQRLDQSGRLRACIRFLSAWFARAPLG